VRYIPVRYVQLCIADIRQAILNSSDYYPISSISYFSDHTDITQLTVYPAKMQEMCDQIADWTCL